MTNLDSTLKSRDVTLPTKVRQVKAMVFPVVMCGWESWTIKKAESQRIDPVVLEKTLESPLDSKIKPANPKGNQSFGYLMQKTDSLEKTLMLRKIEGRRRRR